MGKHWDERTTQAVYSFVVEFIEREGYSPSMQQIGDAVYLTPARVGQHIDLLVARGQLRHTRGVMRSIALPKENGHAPE